MTEGNNDRFYNLTFAQREGRVPLPESMRLEHVSKKFRQFVWLSIESGIKHSIKYGSSQIGDIVNSYFFEIHGKFHDEIPNLLDCRYFLRQIIVDKSYHEILTLVEFFLRRANSDFDFDLIHQLREAFDKCQIAYFIQDINELPTIVPRITKESGDAAQESIETIDRAGMAGASTHLRQAAEHINAGRFSDSIADSIHAVESVARTINPKAKTLGPALDSLQKDGLLKHSALKEAFSKLYGYTSDEQGIRHALLDKPSPDVDLDEAMFMFGACASFAAYLVNKHRKAAQRQGSNQ